MDIHLYPHLTVSQFVHYQTNTWNHQILNELIEPQDQNRIRNCRFSIFNNDDIPSWLHTRSGMYTVRSRYKFMHKLQAQQLKVEEEATQLHLIYRKQ